MKTHFYKAACLCFALLLPLTSAGCKPGKGADTEENTSLAAGAEQTGAAQSVTPGTTEPWTFAQTPAGTTVATQTTTANAGNASSAGTNPVPVQRVGNGIHPLTGLSGYDADYYANKKVIGVVVENHPGARPQWGMSTPDVTFEYEVEGGISRMLWLYANVDELPAMVGPIRSMRHDIVELARGYDLFFIHCGGSSFAREKLKSYNGALASIDGNSFGDCFVRDTTRNTAIEHRLILLGDAFRTAVINRNLNMAADGAHQNFFRFAGEASPFRPGSAACGSIHFEYSPNYTYTFNYNSATGVYEANINGSPRVDDQGILCTYKNVVLLYVDMVDMQTSKGHQDLLLENGGKGVYASNGGYAEITWKKGVDTDMLKLYSADGQELTLNAGKSYIGLVRSTRSTQTVIY